MGRIKLIHYHTNTKDAVPSASNLALGEIAVNTNPESPQLIIKNSTGAIEKISVDSSKFRTGTFTKENNNYTAIDPKTLITSATKGYTNSFYVWKTAGASTVIPNFSAGEYSSGLFFGVDDTKGVISLSYNIPAIVFSGNASSESNGAAWFLKLTGKSKTYDLENFTAATAKKTSGTLSIADQSFNGSADLSIDKLDCGEF